MRRHHVIAFLWSVALCACAMSARAAVTLDSAELTGQSGFQPRVGDLQVRDATPLPFPNDTRKFVGVGPDGLNVSVDSLTGSWSTIAGNEILHQWTDQGFRVVFDLDQPATFAYHRGPDVDVGSVSLRADGQLQPVFWAFEEGDLSGTLAPGRYTFTGDTGARAFVPATPSGGRADILDVRLSVLVPEPAATVALLAALPLCRRRRALRR